MHILYNIEQHKQDVFHLTFDKCNNYVYYSVQQNLTIFSV